MWNVFWKWVLAPDGSCVDARGLSGFGKGVVAGVEVFALLEVFSQVVGLGGELAVEAEEALFVWGEGLEIVSTGG